MAPSDEAKQLPQTLLVRALGQEVGAEIYQERVLRRGLNLRGNSPPADDRSAGAEASATAPAGGNVLDARATRRAARKERQEKRRQGLSRVRPLTAARKRALGLYEIPRAQRRWAVFAPLHRLWCGYMREVLGLRAAEGDVVSGPLDGGAPRNATQVSPAQAGPLLVSADMHGAVVEVVRSRCPSRVGLKGIVVRDLKFVFEVVTERDELKTVPKEHTVFRYEVPLARDPDGRERRPLVFEVLGSQFEHRAPDRAHRKFKMHLAADIV